MIETKPPQALSLFDLIGREWTLDAAIAQLAFNANASAVACALSDGRLAILPVADVEHPEKRIRMDLETGRTTIRPRENPLPPPHPTDATHNGTGICSLGEQGFAVGGHDGMLWQITARGQAVRLDAKGAATVTALCSTGPGVLCVARETHLGIVETAGMKETAGRDLDAPIDRLGVSADGSRIAAIGSGQCTILSADTMDTIACLTVSDKITCLAWSPDGRWITAGCRNKALVIVDVSQKKADRIVDFPASVESVAFSTKANALIASGAFRVVAWRLPDLPFGDHEGDPIQTGKPGLTLVDRVAPNPVRETCAVGYANGLVTVCPLGHRDELMLCEGRGAPVTALDWSGDGTHLALGFADGRAAIVTFPKAMFK